jgi:hypothetical protein
MNADEVRARLKAKYPAEFRDGVRAAFLGKGDGQCEPGDYPLGFHGWPLERRNAWFAGYNTGSLMRAARKKEMAAHG